MVCPLIHLIYLKVCSPGEMLTIYDFDGFGGMVCLHACLTFKRATKRIKSNKTKSILPPISKNSTIESLKTNELNPFIHYLLKSGMKPSTLDTQSESPSHSNVTCLLLMSHVPF